ncbi:MAG: sigma-70 family RNA polymerase sigma factor [Oscillospiraceae bacterium]
MEDEKIIALFWARDKTAIRAASETYTKLLFAVSYNILKNREDADECVNETFLRAWDSIPPQKPVVLSGFLGKIARNLSIDRFRSGGAQKRGEAFPLDGLEECLPASLNVEVAFDSAETARSVSAFLREQSAHNRKIFLLRYWHAYPVKEVAKLLGMSQSRVKSSLHRTRLALKKHLEQEGVCV